jgi:para-nitrobenzyl esterase
MEGAVGACHALELPFVFGLVGDTVLRRFVGDGPRAAVLSDRMQEAWLRFAHDGAPGARDLPAWAGYDPDRRATLILDAECRTEEDPQAAERRLWDDLV